MPASGYRNNNDGGLNNVGNNGNYWSASPNNYHAYSLYFNSNVYVDPSDYYFRELACSVRCLQE